MAEAEKEAAGDDQSMEEILQSIRKIIAEDGEEGDEGASEAQEEANVEVAPDSEESMPEEPQEEDSETESAGSDDDSVLELTDAVQEDGSVVNVTVEEGDLDILDNIDDAIGESEEPPAEEAVVEEAPAEIVSEPNKEKPEPKPEQKSDPEDGLVSDASIAASASMMASLKSAGDVGDLTFVTSGDTVESLVQQLLRPMMKEWLDANLPAIVRQVVEKEVQRISTSMEEDD